MLEMAINNVEVGSEKDRVQIVTFCVSFFSCIPIVNICDLHAEKRLKF